MRQRMDRISPLAAVLAALALTGPAAAGEQVPFTGWQSGVFTQTGFSFPFVIAHSAGVGEATHLGRFTFDGDITINVITGDAAGAFTLTAANGDMLFETLAGHPVDAAHGAGIDTIVGGTGRFQGATGSFADHVTFALPIGSSPNRFDEVLEGTITSPGSNK